MAGSRIAALRAPSEKRRPAREGVATSALGARLAAIALFAPVVLLAIAGWDRRWVSDDAFINLRVVDLLSQGHGPVFNVGEHVEAYTSTLWVGILWLGDAVLPIGLEWVAVVLGLACSVAGLAMATVAAHGLLRERGHDGLPLPLGALVFVALPPVWDFSTSGLETGLSFAWLGASFLALVAVLRRGPRRLPLVALLLGLGPLVRPDFAVFSIAFVVALFVVVRPARSQAIRLVAAAVALPLLYQLFRMGYFASLVPNTAVAKEAGASYWSSGLRYLWDLFGTYLLFLPLLALLVPWARGLRGGGRPLTFVAAAPVAAGAVHMLFVVKVGGDFMHARLLLPGLFAVLMPVAVVAVPARRSAVALAAGVVIWALVCAAALRVPYGDVEVGDVPAGEIVDERAYYGALAGGVRNPVEVEDYARSESAADAFEARRRAEAGERVVVFTGRNPEEEGELPADQPTRAGLRVPFVAAVSNVGIFGYAAGPRVYVQDRLALGDALAARLELDSRGRVGHEKLLPPAYVLARFADPSTFAGDENVRNAHRVLNCSPWIWDGAGTRPSNWLREHLRRIEQPLTVGGFLGNVKYAATGQKLRLPREPWTAAIEICGPY
jgi:arabinofuranosyltransferase